MMTPEQREEAITIIQAIMQREGADLESLSPKFFAERFAELIEEAGYAIIRTQVVEQPLHEEPFP